MKVNPGGVYVIPPNKEMSILHGGLHLFEPSAPRGLRLPIDFFFRSLADDRQGSSIGVLLSGMGSDGTLGVRAIKEKGGLVLVQDPASAKFDSMPRSAIDAGLADLVAPPEELPGKIVAFLRHTLHVAQGKPTLATRDLSALEKVLILLRSRTGQEVSPTRSRPSTAASSGGWASTRSFSIGWYARYLQENPQELDLLAKELLIGVTSFFREPAAWDLLRNKVIPALLAARPAGGTLRAWSAGCSTGEEAYSLAIVFKEALDLVKPKGRFSLQIFATDLDRDAVDKARLGAWPVNIAADVSPERLRRYFSPGGERLPGRQGDPGDGDIRHPEPDHGPPVHQARPPRLPESADLSDAGGAEETDLALPLRLEHRRLPVSGKFPRPSAPTPDSFHR